MDHHPLPPKSLITVSRNGNAIRISRVTAHGDEIIEGDVEAKALAVLLWGKLNKGEMAALGTPLLPWDSLATHLTQLRTAIEDMTRRLDANTHALTVAQTQQQAAKPTPAPRGQ